MKRVKRKKAWVGAVIGLAGSIIGSILNHNAQKKQLKEQEANQYESRNLTTAANLANAINGSQDAANTYYDRMTLMKMGGNRYKRKCEAGSEIQTAIPKSSFDIGELFSGIGTATSSVMSGVNALNSANAVQNVRQAPQQFATKNIKLPTYYDRIAAAQNIYRCGGKKRPVGGNIPYTPEDDFNVIRDINRRRDRRRNEEFNKDALKTAAIIAGSGIAAYPLAGYLGASAAAIPTAAGESITNYLPFAGEWVPAAYTEAAFAPMQYQTLKEYGPQILESIKSIPKSIKEKFSPTEYGPYNLREVTVSAPRKTNSKYKRK